jgi:hypothetical protein
MELHTGRLPRAQWRGPMTIGGQCHCGNIRFALEWPAAEIAARACGCSFCVKHGGLWTSRPDAALVATIADPAAVSRYRFGTSTADFVVCARCGVAPFVTCEIGGRLHAVVNVNTFEGIDPRTIARGPASFDGEDVGSRLERRQRNWIASVRIDTP